MTSPTQRTLAYLRERGYQPAVVEKWNAHARIRQDLFGIIDVVAVGHCVTLGVQACNVTDVAARVAKIREADAFRNLLDAGWVLMVMGWHPRKGEPRVVRVREREEA